MKLRSIFLYITLLFGMALVFAQVSPDCINAIPICNNTPINGGTIGLGSDDFNDAERSGCLGKTLSGSIETNSAWYRFRTGASGELGFNIGFDINEDWDFALYKTSDCSNLGEPVKCNFFDNGDENVEDRYVFIGVGEDPTGEVGNIQYETWLQVEPGEDYYLFINNFSDNNSGFSVQFSGHIFETNPYDALDCSIIDNLLGPPISACENEVVILDAMTESAIDYNWYEDTGSGFQQITAAHSATLQVTTSALYRVNVIVPSGNNIFSDVNVVYYSLPVANPVSDDASCTGTTTYDLSQKDAEALGAQSPSEFIVSYHSSFAEAINGANVLPKQLVTANGSQIIYVRVSSLNNPMCFDASQQFQLIKLETPVMDFDTEVYLCGENSSITIGGSAPSNPNYSYQWDSGEITPGIVVTKAGAYTVTAINNLANLSCGNTKTITVTTSITPEITNVIVEDLQYNNTVTVITNVTDNIEYQLDDGAFQTGNIFTDVIPGMHTISVYDTNGCGLSTEQIVVVGFPKFFTPNGDNNNDLWNIKGITYLNNATVFIYDRFGKLLKKLNQSDAGWDGSFNGKELPSTDYWFKLNYFDQTGQQTTAKYINNHFSLRR